MEVHLDVPEPKTTVTPIAASDIDARFKTRYTDLASAALGTQVLSFSDEWFAAAANLITPTAPIRRAGVFVHTGAWFDGWETRRHNAQAFDWVVFKLGVASGRVAGVEVDTAYFDGNHAPEVAVEGAFIADDGESAQDVKSEDFTGWETILGRQDCGPSTRQAWELASLTQKPYTHIRLLMYPDGGIARFRLYGVVEPVFPQSVDEVFDLAATVNGGVAVACSDQHFGTKDNLLLPGRGKDMGDGWETKRTRGEHVDWAIIRLGARGSISKLVIDTAHFRGNFPQKVAVYALDASSSSSSTSAEDHQNPTHDDARWTPVLAPSKTGPDAEHEFEGAQLQGVEGGRVYSHVKLVIIPDGGVKRIRVFGRRAV